MTGSEKAFAAGADIKEMAELTFPNIYFDDFFHLADRIAQHRKPIIAAVSGYALGGGCELALMCDFIYCAENAKFALPEVTLGVIPGIGGTQRLTLAIGKAKAMEMCLTARQMGAIEAELSGLVARVFSPEELLTQTLSAAEKIAEITEATTKMASDVKMLFPLIIICFGFLSVWLNYKVAGLVLNRLGTFVEPIPSFNNWRFSTLALYIYAFALVGLYWGTTREIYLLKQLSYNIQQLANIIMLIQGLSLCYYLAKK